MLSTPYFNTSTEGEREKRRTLSVIPTDTHTLRDWLESVPLSSAGREGDEKGGGGLEKLNEFFLCGGMKG